MSAPSIRVLLLAAALVVHAARDGHAQVQTSAQRRCITSLNDAGAGVAAAVAAGVATCIARAGTGALPAGQTVQQCIAADDAGKVARARRRTEAVAARHCSELPNFGAAASATVEAAFAQPFSAVAVFGAGLDGAIVPDASDSSTAACQAAVAGSLAKITAARLKEFQTCARQGLKTTAIRSAADLEACVDTDAKGRVARALATARSVAATRCVGTTLATAFPGDCAAATPEDLADCLEQCVDCATCRQIDAADRLAQACHRFQDGVAIEYCGARPAMTSSVARQWDEEILDAIRHDTPRPTVHARNLFHLSAAMWDAWRVYGGGGRAFVQDEAHASSDPESDRATAISFAAYRLLSHRYALSVNSTSTQYHLDVRMAALGFDKHFTDTSGDDPASVGNRIGAAIIAYGAADGANEAGNYGDATYTPVNGPLIVKLGGTVMNDANRWQPLALDFSVTQNGIPNPNKIQSAIGMRWNIRTTSTSIRGRHRGSVARPTPSSSNRRCAASSCRAS